MASERFVFAMPETSIGFFPDIGASHLLVQCPDHLGTYLGLTGNRLNAEEALAAGLIHQVIASEQIPQVIATLQDTRITDDANAAVGACLASFAQVKTAHYSHAALIKKCFSLPTIEAIEDALLAADDPWAKEVLSTLQQKSPLSLKVTLKQLQQAQELSLAQCLQMDFNLVQHFMAGNDFYEGVRALLVDKDKNPKWNPARLDLVRDEMVEHYFQPTTIQLDKFIS